MGHGQRDRGRPVALCRGGAARFAARETLPGPGLVPRGAGTGRIDGVAKVTGAKLYASDFRAADLPGWPADTSHALLVRVAGCDAYLSTASISAACAAVRQPRSW